MKNLKPLNIFILILCSIVLFSGGAIISGLWNDKIIEIKKDEIDDYRNLIGNNNSFEKYDLLNDNADSFICTKTSSESFYTKITGRPIKTIYVWKNEHKNTGRRFSSGDNYDY